MCADSQVVCLCSAAIMEAVNKKERETKGDKEESPNSLRANDRRRLFNLCTHTHTHTHTHTLLLVFPGVFRLVVFVSDSACRDVSVEREDGDVLSHEVSTRRSETGNSRRDINRVTKWSNKDHIRRLKLRFYSFCCFQPLEGRKTNYQTFRLMSFTTFINMMVSELDDVRG